jgi:glycosyltransferase involved in cell wall biosynthesis
MRVVHLSTSDRNGGAARNTYRLHRAFVDAGVDSRLIVAEKSTDDPSVFEAFPGKLQTLRHRIRRRLEAWPLRFYPHRTPTLFSLNWAPNRAWRTVAAMRPDVVHLHWVNEGFVPIGHLRRLRAPLVWSLLDEWPMTGGCHYTGGCRRFVSVCGACPILRSKAPQDLSTRTFRAKQNAWRGLAFNLILFSQQSAALARDSKIFGSQSTNVIAPPVDTSVYRPASRPEARSRLGLDPEAFVVVFGATDLGEHRKGFDLARAAIGSLTPNSGSASMILCTFGTNPDAALASIGSVPVRHFGHLSDESSIARLIAAADATLVPSREDTGPLITIESLACGTPVVGFPVGVTADLVQHERNGFLAKPFDPASLAAGLHWASAHRGEPGPRAIAREAALREADVRAQVPRYLAIYANARQPAFHA